MRSSTELSDLFFQDLKKFNSNNFNILNRFYLKISMMLEYINHLVQL